MNETPQFMWQREYNNKWTNYLYEESCFLNKAVSKKRKTVTLPNTDPKKKIVVNLEKMFQTNLISGFQQCIRCIFFSDSHICWMWQDDCGSWCSYTPLVAFYLEVAFMKQVNKVDICIKDDYEVNFESFTQVNKGTGHSRAVVRERVQMTLPKDFGKCKANPLVYDVMCKNLIKKLSKENIDRIQSFIFNIPISDPDTADVSQLSPAHNEIITALSAEVQASTSQSVSTTVSVDPHCPVSDNTHVYSENGESYNATLNFTNVLDNNNKFFIIQLLKHKIENKFFVWFHWGRVGYKGQNNLINCGKNLDEAKSTYERKFYEKTRNHWAEKSNFQKVPSKYDLVHTELTPAVSRPLASVETKLDLRIQELLNMICNKKNLEEAAKDLCYDSTATPLGNITAKQILEGYGALNQISNILKSKKKGKELIEACNVFYTKIPHNFGLKTPPLLYTMDEVREKLKMLEALSNICLAMDVLNSPGYSSENIIDKYYRSLDCKLIPLRSESEEFHALCKCLLETHGPTHSAYSMELIDAFMCVKDEQEASFVDVGNKRLLWHGSRVSNWLGILKKGLQIAPLEAPSTGYMFGKGIYFADVSSKSANYCFATKKNNEGLLLLSEVSLGNSLVAYEASDLSKLPAGYHSVHGIGKVQPSCFEASVLSPDASVPCGPLETGTNEALTLHYNEYIVYSIRQVKMKYLLRIRFNF